MNIPWTDWQFWTASLLAVLALWFIVRPILPSRRKNPKCPSCTAPQPKSGAVRTELTVDGERPARGSGAQKRL
ncbi:MAG: hypothetical protein EBR10_03395 [Planctomycetes bacterium]|nr:hypothetical protein [Planctomycetota bacterium]